MKKMRILFLILFTSFFVRCQDEKIEIKQPVVKSKVKGPENNYNFSDTTGVFDLLKVSDIPNLKPGYGSGGTLTNFSRYIQLKSNTHMYWVVSNCNQDSILAKSQNSNQLVFGASVPKIVVASSALWKNNDKLKKSEWRDISKLLVVSSNDPQWSRAQDMAGGASGVRSFCKQMGYKMSPEKLPGCNLVSADEMAKFYRDLTQRKFVGSESILKLSGACATSLHRSKVYIPDSIPMGGKTGTWSQYIHDTGWLFYKGEWWSIVVLSDGGFSSEDIAIMWGGLFREYILQTLDPSKIKFEQKKVIKKKKSTKKRKSKKKKK
jgi:hypothetical protein